MTCITRLNSILSNDNVNCSYLSYPGERFYKMNRIVGLD